MANRFACSVPVLALTALAAWCVLVLLANLYNFPPVDIRSIFIAVAAILVPIIITFQLARATQTIAVLVVFLIALSFRLAFVFLVHNQPVSDFATVYEMATTVSAAGNVTNINTSPYFQVWSHQIPFTLFEALIINLIGHSLIAIKLVNAILSSILAALLVAIGARWFGFKEGLLAGLVMALWPENLAMVSAMSNQVAATTLLYGGLLALIVDRGTFNSSIGSGILLSVSNLVRPIGPVTLLAAAQYLWVENAPLRQRIRRILILVAAFGVTHMAMVGAGGLLGVKTNWYQNGIPAWKFAVGLNTQTYGALSQEDMNLIRPYEDGAPERAKIVALQRIGQPSLLPELVARKAVRMWGGGGLSFSLIEGGGVSSSALRVMASASQWIYLALSVFGLVAVHGLRKRKCALNGTRVTVLMGGLVALYFVAHLLIEIQPRYRYEMMPVLALLGGAGLLWTWDRCSQFVGRLGPSVGK